MEKTTIVQTFAVALYSPPIRPNLPTHPRQKRLLRFSLIQVMSAAHLAEVRGDMIRITSILFPTCPAGELGAGAPTSSSPFCSWCPGLLLYEIINHRRSDTTLHKRCTNEDIFHYLSDIVIVTGKRCTRKTKKGESRKALKITGEMVRFDKGSCGAYLQSEESWWRGSGGQSLTGR